MDRRQRGLGAAVRAAVAPAVPDGARADGGGAVSGRLQAKLVASDGLAGELTFEEALSLCKYRSICTPGPRDAGEKIALHACVTLLGAPARLNQQLVERLAADVAAGRSFMIAAEYEATMRQVLGLVDQRPPRHSW